MLYFQGVSPSSKTSMFLDYYNARRVTIDRILNDNTLYTANEIRNSIITVADRRGESATSLYTDTVDRFTLYCKFNITGSSESILQALSAYRHSAIPSGNSKSTEVRKSDSFGETDGDQLFSAINKDKSLYKLADSYKFYLNGIIEAGSVINPTKVPLKRFMSLLTYLVMFEIDQGRITRDVTIARQDGLLNTADVNKVLPTTTSEKVEDLVRTTLQSYIVRELKTGTMTYEEFIVNVRDLFMKGADVIIVPPQSKAYMRSDVENLIIALSERFPDTKFERDFLNSTETFEEWVNLDPKQLENELGVTEFTLDSTKTNSLGLKEVTTVNINKLSNQRESTTHAYILSITSDTESEREFYYNVYQDRMNILKHNKSTYVLYERLLTQVKSLEPASLQMALMHHKNKVNPIVAERISSAQRSFIQNNMITTSKSGDLVDEDTKAFLKRKIQEHIYAVATDIIAIYKASGVNHHILFETDPVKTLAINLNESLEIKNRVMYLLGHPINIGIPLGFARRSGISSTSVLSEQMITEDYLIHTSGSIYRPELLTTKATGKASESNRIIIHEIVSLTGDRE